MWTLLEGNQVMTMRIQNQFAALLAALLIFTHADTSVAQNGCGRCATPALDQRPTGINGQVTRNRVQYRAVEDTPPLPSPYYSTESLSDQSDSTALNASSPMLLPTGSRSQPALEKRPPQTAPAVNPQLVEKISQRYSDPRIIRMVQQMSSANVDSLYAETSELIDERHISPPNYQRRVDSAISHLIQALNVPAFANAAQIQASQVDISNLQAELEDFRNTMIVKNLNDARNALRKVQLLTAQSIDMRPAAIGMEFVYGSTDSLDQFSMLLPPEKTGGPSVGLRDNVVGIGVEVESHPTGLKILKLLPGGPAAQADLRPGDVITHVDGVDLKQMELNRAVDYIVGPIGTPIQIQASRSGKSGRVTLTRQKVSVHSVTNVQIVDPSRGVGYLKLEQFAESSTQELETALQKLHQQGMQSLIIDLRGNPGGLLTTAISVSDTFLPSGTIVSTKGRTQDDNSKEVAQFAKTWKTPLVVLVDKHSASASEIFAAAIQENGRGLIVGEKSYGKGTVQTLFPMQSFPVALRLTTAKFYSPQGREMAGAGVTPDVKVASAAEGSQGEDPVLAEAIRLINQPRIKDMAERFRRTGKSSNDNHFAA